MKTGNSADVIKMHALLLLGVAVVALLAAGGAVAQVVPPPPAAGSGAPASASAPASGDEAMDDDESDDGDSPGPIVTGPAGSKSSTSSTALKDERKKVPESVKKAISALDKTKEDITLDDLNAARLAIAKVDILIELEKKLKELEKVREEKTTKPTRDLASLIPQTALTPPPSMAMPKLPEPSTPVAPPAFDANDIDVVRVVGGEGRYKAVIKKDGTTRTVQVGDKVPGGAVVTAISATDVTFLKNDKKDTVRIKNVDVVFGSKP